VYLKALKLWNFRKYGSDNWDLNKPNLKIYFDKQLNVLVGENDSGKTAVIDAIKLVLKTHSYEWLRVSDLDFYRDSNKFRIELFFVIPNEDIAKNFIEWLTWKEHEGNNVPILKLILEVERKNGRILPYEVRAGNDTRGLQLSPKVKEYLKCTYLKPLRDAENELIAKKNSRLSQILRGHELFRIQEGHEHDFVRYLKEFNKKIMDWFEDDAKASGEKSNKELIKNIIDNYLKEIINNDISSEIKISKPEIKSILDKISLELFDIINPGLGSMNRLFMAAEFLNLKNDEWDGLKLCLVEELEAHLHPQAQLKIIQRINKEENIQFILTSHSPNITSKVDLKHIQIFKEDKVFSLKKKSTILDDKNYKFLKRFLDVTKSNLFFSKGVILVEGWSEEIILPAIAKKIGYDLNQKEVSIINVGSTAYLHFAKIFIQKEPSKRMGVPVSVITDLDVKPDDNGTFDTEKEDEKRESIESKFDDFNDDVKLFIAKQWTLEWCLFKSININERFKKVVSEVHSRTEEFQNEEFQNKLIQKLKKNKSSGLDKVSISNLLADEIELNNNLNFDDDYLKYLTDAIKHACGDDV
jgi:putative ATP-dependent endonuclease of OLD family